METLLQLQLRLSHCRQMLAESYHDFAIRYWKRQVDECEHDLELMAVVPKTEKEGAGK